MKTQPIIYTRRASGIPGDTCLELTRPAVDAQGTEYPVGTLLRPLASGTFPSAGKFLTATIDGERITFLSWASIREGVTQ